ncbi:MAG: dihydrodipicolinate synthase family protein [Candidatus Hydrogenedentes bacterium]|nr:dihydrodipicolinate synthase family protein [Candidatus Hydrogenedentota bacterium]
MKFQINGVIPAILTPFTKGGKSVDYDRVKALAARLAGQGVHGLFVCGTTGEGPLMTLDERKLTLQAVVQEVGKRVTVVAHTGCFDTASTIELTRHARDIGAKAAGIVAPGFFGYDDAALLAHYRAIAAAVKDFPILLYNIPGCAKNELTPPVVLELARTVDNIVGIKDSSGSMPNLNRVLADKPADFTVINGVDEYAMQAQIAGAAGFVASTANVLPEVFLGIYNSVKKGDLKKAWETQKKLGRACAAFCYGRMVARYKEGLRLRGFDAGYVRSPQRELTKQEKSELAKALNAAGLI